METGETSAEQIMGSAYAVDCVGLFFLEHSDKMTLIRMDRLLRYCLTENFNDRERDAYLKGGKDILDAMRLCAAESKVAQEKNLLPKVQ